MLVCLRSYCQDTKSLSTIEYEYTLFHANHKVNEYEEHQVQMKYFLVKLN